MRFRTTRTLVAVLAALGLVGAVATMPALAVTSTPDCAVTADGSTTEEVTDGVALTYDSDFACTDADVTGTWTITVTVANDSDTDVTIDALSLSHTSPPFGDDEASTADAGATLPLEVPAQAVGTFDATGEYALVDTGEDGALVNLHLRASGTTADDESAPFVLGINVHVLGPGAELDENGDEDGGADGRPEWVPGPPPWVIEILRGIFPDGFPWGSDIFPPAGEDGTDADADAGPPATLTLPPPAIAGGDDSGDGSVPLWVNPGGPPAWAPAGADDDEEDAEGDGLSAGFGP